MTLKIANPIVVAKIERLARATGLSRIEAVERAVDRLIAEQVPAEAAAMDRFRAILAQIDRLPDRTDAADPLLWDKQGIPR